MTKVREHVRKNFMEYKVSWILVLCLAVLIPTLMLQAQEPLKAPTTVEEAKALFSEGWALEKQAKYNEALARYTLLVASLDNFPTNLELNAYRMSALNNIGGIQSESGKYQEAIATFKNALEFATKIDDYYAMSEYYHKLGIIYSQYSTIKAQQSPLSTPEAKKLQQLQSLLLTNGSYVRMGTTDEEIGEERIRLYGSQHPIEKQTDLYNKLVNLKVTGDFNPNELLVPDLVDLQIKIEKKGYYGVVQRRTMPSDIDYTEVQECLSAKQRLVDAQISEDFYTNTGGRIPVDEITLTSLDDLTKTIPITDKQKFPPGKYRLDIRRRGYEPITENLTIVPGEEAYVIARQLKSSLRNVTYKIQGDFDALGSSAIEPDEITLNGQVLSQNMLTKPGEYKLVIREEGYDPIVKTIIIEPNNQPYPIVEYMKTLPREVLFQITGDYQKDEVLTPDEVALNGKNIKYGESVKPSRYNTTIRRRGYDTYNNEIVIEPKAGPYLLSALLKSTPRRVLLEITAQFPEGAKITQFTCTLNNQPCTGDQSFKPGEYEIVIKSAGYEDVVKKIRITPDEVPYVHREILKPKSIEINTDITQDVAHDNPEIKPILTLINERTKEVQVVKHGDKIQPGIYVAKVEMDGYETSLTKESIMPSEQPYKIATRLLASNRKIIPRILAEYPEGEMLQTFDYITLGGKTVTKDFQIKPGVHEVIIRKEGYIDIQKNIRIFANSMEYLLVDNMQTQPRLITFNHVDKDNGKEVAPNQFSCNSTPVTTKSITLKPGTYNFKGQTEGYYLLDMSVSVPVGAVEFPVKVEWKPQEREVITFITTDYEKESGEVLPDLMKLGELTIGKKSNIRPGKYPLLVKKEGYYEIKKEIAITPSDSPYEIKEELKTIPRTVTTRVMSAYGNTPIEAPNTITRNGNPLTKVELKPGVFSFVEEIKPGTHKFMVQHQGYQPLEEDILIETSKTKELEIVLTLYPSLVKVGYELVGYKDMPLAPQEITVDSQAINQDPNTDFSTGRHSLIIREPGYKLLEEDIEIEPREEPYIIKRTLEPIARPIEPYITADYSGDNIIPEVMTLNNVDATVNDFMPGEYTLEIQAPGYQSIKETVEIEPSPDLYRIERILVSKPRLIKEKITFDVPAPDKLPPHKITMALVEKPDVERVIKDGDNIKPGTYNLVITKQAYEIFKGKKTIFASEEPFVIEAEMIAQQVLLRISITYDIPAPSSLPNGTVTLITPPPSSFNNVVADGNKIKPGGYKLEIQRPGYYGGPSQDIYIEPSENAYPITRELKAKPRQLSFQMIDPIDGSLVPAYEILADGKKVGFSDLFQPGTEIELTAKFIKYKTATSRVKIEPGEGPFVAPITLERLVRRDVVTIRTEEIYDGVKYPYVFYEDNNKIETHHITSESAGGTRIQYTFFADAKAQKLHTVAGYMFTDKPMGNPGTISNFTNISTDGLIEHLETKRKSGSTDNEILDIISRILQRSNTRTMMQTNGKENQKLIDWLKANILSTEGGIKSRLDVTIKTLEGYLK